MSDYLLISKRMKIKKGDAIEESKSIDDWVSNIMEYTTGGFEAFLENINATKKIKLFAKNIEWEIILSLFNIRFYEMIVKFELPKHSDEHLRNLGGFRVELFQSIKIEIYFYIFYWIKKYSLGKTINEFNNDIFNFFAIKMNKLFQAFEFQYFITSLREVDNPEVIIIELDEKKFYEDIGRKFAKGDSDRANEIRTFKIIISMYNKLYNNYNSPSYRKIALKVAKDEFGIEDKLLLDDGKWVNLFSKYYDRFIYYKNKVK